MEDPWFAATAEGHLQSLQAKLRVKAARQLPAENMPGVEIHDRHQVQESFLQWDGGDVSGPHVSGPHLIHRRDRFEIHQAGIPLGRITGNRGAGFLVNRMSNPCGA